MIPEPLALEAPVNVRCIEYRTMMTGGNSLPLLMVARDADESTFQVVVKLRHPASDDGHAEGTSLACELICAVLARAAGLTVPDYFIAEISPELAAAIPDRRIRALLERNVGPNFATRYLRSLPNWLPGYNPAGDLADRLEGVMTFDACLTNGDRKRSKPNLLWKGDDVVLIDHSLALPAYRWSDQEIAESPLLPEHHVRLHAAFSALRNEGRQYREVMDVWEELPWSEVAALRSMIPARWEQRSGHLDRIFVFLTDRDRRFSDVSSDLRRIAR